MATDEFGFDPALGEESLVRRHRELVRQLHPDAHPGASPAQRAELERRMQAMNEAWERVRRAPPMRAAPSSAEVRAYAPAPPRPRSSRPPVHETPGAAPGPSSPSTTSPTSGPDPRRRGRWLAVSGVALLVVAGGAVVAGSTSDDDRPGAVPQGCPTRSVDTPLARIDSVSQSGTTVVLAGSIANPYREPLAIRTVQVRYQYRTFANIARADELAVRITSPPLAPAQSERFRWTGTVAEAGDVGAATVDGVEAEWQPGVPTDCPIS